MQTREHGSDAARPTHIRVRIERPASRPLGGNLPLQSGVRIFAIRKAIRTESTSPPRTSVLESLSDLPSGAFSKWRLGGGEPTILSDFPQLLAAIRHHDMVPNVTTNGVLNSEKILHALAEYAGTVHLSADRSELLDAARGEGVSDHIKETARRLSALNIRWGVNLLLTPHNVRSLRSTPSSKWRNWERPPLRCLRPKGTWTSRNWPGLSCIARHELDRRGGQPIHQAGSRPAPIR